MITLLVLGSWFLFAHESPWVFAMAASLGFLLDLRGLWKATSRDFALQPAELAEIRTQSAQLNSEENPPVRRAS